MVCRICWRNSRSSAVYQCSNCSAIFHLKCDTSDTCLVKSHQGIMVHSNKVPCSKAHFNWCHLCQ
ncbi:MAG: hypothetical protein MHPSP_003616, partial [Paramarteilia canceri]